MIVVKRVLALVGVLADEAHASGVPRRASRGICIV